MLVIAARDGAKALLSRRIPSLNFDLLAIQVSGLLLVLKAQSLQGVVPEGLIEVARQETGLPH